MREGKDDSGQLTYKHQIDDIISFILGTLVIALSYLPLRIYFWIRRRSRPLRPEGRPPESAEYLMSVFLRRETREPILGDLEEEFALQQQQYGAPPATLWYWGQAIRVVGKSPIISAAARLVRYGSAIGGFFRRII